MGKVLIDSDRARGTATSGGVAQKPINLAVTAWHAAFPSGGAVNATSGFTQPSAAQADRIPQLALATGGTPGSYVLTGTWNGETQTETVGPTVAEATVKATKPFDTITSVTGPDPGADLTLQHGDSYADPPALALWTGDGGDLECQLVGETAVQTITGLPANQDYRRRVRRVSPDNTTITTLKAYFVW